jgi:hypothetical protein
MSEIDTDAGATTTPSGRSAATPQRRDNAYFLGRLRNERPDLYDKVLAGVMSVFAACVEAGLRGSKLTPVEEIMRRIDALSKEDFRTCFQQVLIYAKSRRH